MSWTALTPIVKTTGRAMVTAAMVSMRNASPKLTVNLAGTLFGDLGEPAHAHVMAGSGEHAGQLQITFAPDGAFRVTRFAKGGARIWLPPFDGMPDVPTESLPCRIVERDTGTLIIALPIEGWAEARAARLAPKVKSDTPPALTAKPAPAPADKRLDAIEYLQSKGHKCSRLAGGRFGLDGDTVLAVQILEAVNKHRKRADLAALALAEIR